MQCPAQTELDKIFPPDLADKFFDAIYGGAEEGAYDIRLVCRQVTPEKATFAFELVQRPGKCLACSLTYGLPQVFTKHPIINMPAVASALGELLGWGKNAIWELEPVEEASKNLHIIPLILYPQKHA